MPRPELLELDASPGSGFDRSRFEWELVEPQRPALLRRLVSDWPLVRLLRDEGLAALAQRLREADSGQPSQGLLLRPEARGRIGYAADGQGFNFLRKSVTLSEVLGQLERYAAFDPAPAVALQSAPVAEAAPSLAGALPLPLIEAEVAPRLWLGNQVTTPAHFDESHNIACVVAGRRRFALFPPGQVANLYPGPLGQGPTGTPISLAHPDEPDLVRFPRLAEALAAMQLAELEPGDAIYIPPLWWHQVRSLEAWNLLVNFWWAPAPLPSGLDALLHALWALRDLPAPQRAGWQQLFEHWIFRADEQTHAHLPPPLKGVHAPLTPALREAIGQLLRQKLG